MRLLRLQPVGPRCQQEGRIGARVLDDGCEVLGGGDLYVGCLRAGPGRHGDGAEESQERYGGGGVSRHG